MTEKLSLAPLATTLSYSKTWIKKVYMKAEMVLFCLRFLASKQNKIIFFCSFHFYQTEVWMTGKQLFLLFVWLLF